MITVNGQAAQVLQDGVYQIAEIDCYALDGTTRVAKIMNEDIIANTLTVQESCSASGSIEIGTLVSNQMQVRIRTTRATANALKGKKVVLHIEWLYAERTYEYAYIFSGAITEVRRVSDGIYQITALDGSIVFDAPFHISELLDPDDPPNALAYPVSVLKLFRAIIYSKGAPYIDKWGIIRTVQPLADNAADEINTLPEDQGYTYRQVLQWCAQWMGVNIRVAGGGAADNIEMWFYGWPSQIPESERFDQPWGIDGGNAYGIEHEDPVEFPYRIMIKNGSNVLHSTGDSQYGFGSVVIADNQIINQLYAQPIDYTDPNPFNFQARANLIFDRISDALIIPHCAGSIRATPRLWVQPGDYLGCNSSSESLVMIPLNITHKLNGATTMTCGVQNEADGEADTSTAPFSPEQANALTARLQDVCFSQGDVFEGATIANGIITNTSREINLVCPLNKFIPMGLRLNITQCDILLREPSGYYVESTSFTDALSYISSTARLGTSLRINLIKSGGWKNSRTGLTQTNNVPLAGNVRLRIAFY